MKRYWKNDITYQRILQILDDYWLKNKNEKMVIVEMRFLNWDNQSQYKRICWHNPNVPKMPEETLEATLENSDGFEVKDFNVGIFPYPDGSEWEWQMRKKNRKHRKERNEIKGID